MRETYRSFKTDKDGKPSRRYWKLVYNAALRLGEAVPLNNFIDFVFEGDEYPNTVIEQTKHDVSNVRFLGTLFINDKAFDDIVFVHTTKYGRPRFITFYPKSEDVSASESTVEPLIALALEGEAIPPSEVVRDMHPEFVRNQGINPLVLINRLKNLAEDDAKRLLEIAEGWKDQATAATKRANILEEEYKQLEAEHAQLKAEEQKREEEKAKAAAKGESIVENEGLILLDVKTDVLIANSLNTVLTFEDGSQKTMKVSTWDKDLSITAKAKSLIGRPVITTCWDPIAEPGKWSKKNYFRNIYEVN